MIRPLRGSMSCVMRSVRSGCVRSGMSAHRAHLPFRLWRLRRVGAKQAVFEWRTIEAADDRVHLFAVRGFDKRESLGFLRFVVADDLNRIRDQIVSREPLFDVVGGYPHG